MLLLDDKIFKRVLNQLYKPESEFDSFKIAFFNKFNSRKNHIIKRLVKSQIDEKMQRSFIDDKTNKTKEAIKANLENIYSAINVDELWDVSDKKISRIIDAKDYDAALKYCCLEHNEIIVGICKLFVEDYPNIALGVLKDDSNLSEAIIKKYFSEYEI